MTTTKTRTPLDAAIDALQAVTDRLMSLTERLEAHNEVVELEARLDRVEDAMATWRETIDEATGDQD